MRSRLYPLRIPHPVFEGSVHREHLFTYGSLAQYWINLARRDLIEQPDHDLTKWYSLQSEADQDFMDDLLHLLPRPAFNNEPPLTHQFCAGILQVMMTKHRCSQAQAFRYLPRSVQALCASCGIC